MKYRIKIHAPWEQESRILLVSEEMAAANVILRITRAQPVAVMVGPPLSYFDGYILMYLRLESCLEVVALRECTEKCGQGSQSLSVEQGNKSRRSM